MRLLKALIVVVVASCGSLPEETGGPPNAGGASVGVDPGDDDPAAGGVVAACGQRGQPCCSGMCNARASCDGNVCIALDVWASGPDGTFNFNGGLWVQPLLSGSTQPLPGVNALWGASADFVVGVGTGGLILRRDATGWHRDAVANPDGSGTLYGVGGSGPNDVWAVGDAVFEHYDGATWTSVTPPTTIEPFFTVWLSAPGEGWAAGQSGLLARLSGGTWTFVSRQGNGFDKYSIWGNSASDVWKVGERHSIATGLPMQIQHYDGTAWVDVTRDFDPQGLMPLLHSVWGSDATHVWAVGDGGVTLFWNGTAWKPVLSNTTADLLGVWGSGPSDVWAIGGGGVRHYDGSAWGEMLGPPTAPVAIWLSRD